MDTARRTFHALVLLAALGAAGDVAAQRVETRDKTALLGSLHAHSVLSGDVSDDHGLSPEDTYEAARLAGLDFLGISDHHKAPTSGGSGTRFTLAESDYEDLVATAEEFTASNGSEFVAIAGIEWGTISKGNHVNVFGSDALPPDSIAESDYDELYEWIAENALFAQFNHPYSFRGTRTHPVGNYGRALYGDNQAAFVEEAGAGVRLMSIICTVAGGHISGEHADSTAKTHRDVHPDAFREYRKHLDMGLKLSPAANQDTHGTNPGSVTAARTGVWVDEVSLDGIAEAIAANRVFATEDDELAVAFLVEHEGKEYWMGETVPLGAEEAEVTVRVVVGQAGTGASEGPYVATVFSDSDGIGGGTATEWDSFVLDGEGEHEFALPVVAGEYVLLEISEEGGNDNPVGDGDDEDGPGDVPDGARDDLDDIAWTSPIWFELGGFVWSRNSSIFHDADCWVVARIGQANRREGATPPAGMTKHDCR